MIKSLKSRFMSISCLFELRKNCCVCANYLRNQVISVALSSAIRRERSPMLHGGCQNASWHHKSCQTVSGIESQTEYDHLKVFRHLFMSKHGTLGRWQPSPSPTRRGQSYNSIKDVCVPSRKASQRGVGALATFLHLRRLLI